MAFLQGPSAKQAEVIKQELGENPGDLERGVRDLQNMLAASPYLPEPDSVDRKFLELFIRGCRMDQDRARNKLKNFFLGRSRFRDLYEHISLSVPPLNDVCKYMDIVPLPKLTDEGYRVTILRLRDLSDNSVDISDVTRAVLLVSDVRMHDETLIAGDVFIWEMSQVQGVSIVAKLIAAAQTARQGIYLAQAAYPQRMKRIHVVGARPFLASSLQFIRSCVNEKVRQRYYIHQKIEDLLEHIPARVLPEEWGGEEVPIDSLARRWRNRVDDLKDYLRNLQDLSHTAPTPISDNDMFGTIGAFRKLDID